MARGGRRPGSGRKKGSVSRETAERKSIAMKALAEGISPLDVMLGAMRTAWEAGDKKEAAGFAEKAAPYVHARLSAVEHKGDADNPLAFVTKIELVAVHDNRKG